MKLRNLITLIIITQLGPVFASHIWTGNYNNQWNRPENWSPMIVPNNTHDVVIPASFTNQIIITDANASCKSLTYTGTGFTLSVNNGWNLILSGDLNITGNTKIEGLGGIEIIGSQNCLFNHSDSSIFKLHHINIKSSAITKLNNDLVMPDGEINLFSGSLVTNGFPVKVKAITVLESFSSRILDITHSKITLNRLSLSLRNGGEIAAPHSSVCVSYLIYCNGFASLDTVHASSNVSIVTSGDSSHIGMVHLFAQGDININGNWNYQNQNFKISEFYIEKTPCIVSLTPSPYVSQYNIKNFRTPTGCKGQILFTDNSEVANDQALINTTHGQVINRAAFANIKINSGSLTATQSSDIGNNTGINFTNTLPQEYFWINGNGNWNDTSHWAANSGGTPCGCIPSLNDHVFFDQQSGFSSGDSVIISEHIFANDLRSDINIVNKPILAQNSYLDKSINVNGSLDLKGFQSNSCSYPTFFWSNHPASIELGSFKFYNHIYFMTAGTWELLDDLNCNDGNRNLNQLMGTITTGGHDLTLSGFISKGLKKANTNRGLYLSSSTIHVGMDAGSGGKVILYADSLLLDAGTSNFIFEHLESVLHDFTIEGESNLNLYNVHFKNQVISPTLQFNRKSRFNRVTFNGNGLLTNGSPGITPLMSTIDTLIITGGFRYEFDMQRFVNVSQKLIQIHTSCNELSFIGSNSLEHPAFIYSNNSLGIEFENCWLENISASGTSIPFIVTNGINGGNNNQFTFLQPNISRVFYWNGESSAPQWSLADNWNINIPPHIGNANDGIVYNPSGCLPGFNDSVVFHPYSFPINDTVEINSIANFKGMCWMTSAGSTKILAGDSKYELNNYGGLSFCTNLLIPFSGTYQFRSPFSRTIATNSVIYPGIMRFYNLGHYQLLDDLTCYGKRMDLLAGSFSSNNHQINTVNFNIDHRYAPNSNANIINLGNSNIYINSGWMSYLIDGRSTISADQTYVEFQGLLSTMTIIGDMPNLNLHNVNYSNPNSEAVLNSYYYSGQPRFTHINFEPGATIFGDNEIDTLVLAEGEVYQLEAGVTQQINNLLYSKGSPCFRTTITSTIPGVQAGIVNPTCNIFVKHARLRDINGVLGGCSSNNYIVDVGGEDLGNNSNWTFIPGDPINGLGEDTMLSCRVPEYLQLSSGFGSYDLIVWNDLSTNPNLQVSDPGTISATVTYSPRCIITDERNFTFNKDFKIVGKASDIRCNSANDGMIATQIEWGNGNYQYQWIYPNGNIINGDTIITNLGPGDYIFHISQTGGPAVCADTANFSITEPEKLTIELDKAIPGKCQVAEGIIEISVTGGAGEYSYYWNNDETSEDNYAALSGLNEVTVTDTNGCTISLNVDLDCIERLNVPQLVTPNGDGFGDEWEVIDLKRLFPNNHVKIFNRWGNMVFEKQSYDNQFTGLSNTATLGDGYLPAGTYFYIIELGDGYENLTGFVELIY